VSSVVIIDSGGANIGSVENAFRRLGVETTFTSDPEKISAADKVILPGVGAAASAMNHLENHGLVDCIRDLEQPVLGICLGMQLLFDSSSEGNTQCLALIPGRLERMPEAPGIRIPHMGWNATTTKTDDPLLSGLPSNPWFYFVHSYYAPVGNFTLASSEHGTEFSAIVKHENFYGAQFHPERSASDGARLLQNFMELPCS
jgi:glutamine amidotransferase